VTYLIFYSLIDKAKLVQALLSFRRDIRTMRDDTDREIKMAYESINHLLRKINCHFEEALDWQPGTAIEEPLYPAVNSILRQMFNSSIRIVTFRGNSIFRPPPSERCEKELT